MTSEEKARWVERFMGVLCGLIGSGLLSLVLVMTIVTMKRWELPNDALLCTGITITLFGKLFSIGDLNAFCFQLKYCQREAKQLIRFLWVCCFETLSVITSPVMPSLRPGPS